MFNVYATDYAPVDPIAPPCDIVPMFIGYVGENKARCVVFDLSECVGTFGEGGFAISFIRQGDEVPYLVTDTDRLDNNAIWIINNTDTAVDGYGMVQLQYIVGDVVCKTALYRTVTFASNGIPGDVPDPYEDLLAQIAAYAAQAEGAATTAKAAAETATNAVEAGITAERSQRIAADEGLQNQITALKGLAGAPSMAATAAAMTDSNKVYVYTGNEAGYTKGHWYYYSGAEWVDGGVYNATALETDKTLTVEGMAADAAACGDLKSQIMSAFVEESASGSIASFNDGADDVSLKSLIVNIKYKQSGSGEPSPSNIRTLTGFDACNVYVRGKNLWDEQYPNISGSMTYKPIYVGNGSFTMSTTLPLDAGSANLFFLAGNVTSGASTGGNGVYLNRPVTQNAVGGYVTVAYRIVSDSSLSPALYNAMVERGTSATEYEPYNNNSAIYNIGFETAGIVYEAVLDVMSGMLTITHGAVTLNGSETWASVSASGNTYRCNCSTYDNVIPINATNLVISDKTVPFQSGVTLDANKVYHYIGNGSYHTSLLVGSSFGTSTKDAFLAWLAANPVTLVYPFINPVSVQLSKTDVRSLLGNNNIWSDTGSVASLEYRADTGILINKLTNAIVSLGGNI